MTKFEFYLSETDTERVFYLMEKAGENNLSANEFAKKLLVEKLHAMCFHAPKTDEQGNYI